MNIQEVNGVLTRAISVLVASEQSELVGFLAEAKRGKPAGSRVAFRREGTAIADKLGKFFIDLCVEISEKNVVRQHLNTTEGMLADLLLQRMVDYWQQNPDVDDLRKQRSIVFSEIFVSAIKKVFVMDGLQDFLGVSAQDVLSVVKRKHLKQADAVIKMGGVSGAASVAQSGFKKSLKDFRRGDMGGRQHVKLGRLGLVSWEQIKAHQNANAPRHKWVFQASYGAPRGGSHSVRMCSICRKTETRATGKGGRSYQVRR